MKQSLAVASLALFAPSESAYFTITTTQSYRESEKICQSNGGVLASFHDDSEYAYAVELCEAACDTYDAFNDRCGCWVGLLDWGKEGNFKWQDRSTKEYVMSSSGQANTGIPPWYAGEPNNWAAENFKGEDCVHIWKADDYLLNDIDCADDYFAICEENTKEYFSIQSQFNYRYAAKECREEGGVLASFHDDDEFTTAQTVCEEVCDTLDASNSGCGCWVGLKDQKEEDDWHWEDQSFKNYVMLRTGKAVSGDPWYPGEPNNAADEDCVHIWKAQGYALNDIDCESASYYAICTRYVPNRLPAITAEEEDLEEEDEEEEKESVLAAPALVGHSATQSNTLVMVGVPAAVMVVAAAAYAVYSTKKTGEHKALLDDSQA